MKYIALNHLLGVDGSITSVSILDLFLDKDEMADGFRLNLSLRVNLERGALLLKMSFFQVTNLSIKNLFYESELYEFSIVDHSDDQYQNSNRFEILDDEDERIHFYCKSYDYEKLD